MSLSLALAFMDRLGVRECTVIPDTDPQYATLTTDRELTKGAAAILTSRMRMAILEHRRALSESVDVLEEPWTLERRDTGAWILQHPTCKLLSLPRYVPSGCGCSVLNGSCMEHGDAAAS